MESGKETMPSKSSHQQNVRCSSTHAILAITVITLLLSLPARGQSTISPAEAKSHVGEKATVCGKVAGTHYAAGSPDDPTFINLAKPYSEQVFKVVIWGRQRAKFGTPEQDYRGKHICVTGEISEFKGIPQIVATNPSQIRIQ